MNLDPPPFPAAFFRDHRTRVSRGYAFVRFPDPKDADDALKGMEGFEYDGREL